MNPGKVVHPRRLDQNLRMGPRLPARSRRHRLRVTRDDHRFSRAASRCVGVGKCRGHESGVMCPSYRATGEEEHSTRGRARLLFEMLNGEEITDGWRSTAVRDALDLCLACKGCLSDCPVDVDMATYKAEFLSHHYRPRAAGGALLDGLDSSVGAIGCHRAGRRQRARARPRTLDSDQGSRRGGPAPRAAPVRR